MYDTSSASFTHHEILEGQQLLSAPTPFGDPAPYIRMWYLMGFFGLYFFVTVRPVTPQRKVDEPMTVQS